MLKTFFSLIRTQNIFLIGRAGKYNIPAYLFFYSMKIDSKDHTD